MSILSSYFFGRNPNGFVLKLLGNLKHNINNMKQYVHELTHSLNFKKKNYLQKLPFGSNAFGGLYGLQVY